MSQKESLETLVQFIDLAFRRGVYQLVDAEQILEALSVFKLSPDQQNTSKLTPEASLESLAKFLDLATRRGAFHLTETELLIKALSVFKTTEELQTTQKNDESSVQEDTNPEIQYIN